MKGGMTIPNIATFDHGTYDVLWNFLDYLDQSTLDSLPSLFFCQMGQ